MPIRPSHRYALVTLTIPLALLATACEAEGQTPPAAARPAATTAVGDESRQIPAWSARVDDPEPILDRRAFQDRYPWRVELDRSASWPRVTPLEALFRPPAGYERVELPADSFGAFLRQLPLRLDRRQVYSYAGRPISAPSAAVAMLPVGDRNLQQCADALIRLRAEYLWQAGLRDAIAFHFTSGHRSSWPDWQRGERFVVDGASVKRRSGPPRPDTHAAFVDYLQHLFMYAGTRSLSSDAQRVPADAPIHPGDFFLDPGSPGHAVIVLDVAESSAGHRLALLGQSFMPAQEFHVLRGSHGPGGAVWFELPGPRESIKTPSWRAFSRSQTWRF